MAAWHEVARKMRAAGSTLQSIADEFGVTRQRAEQVCRGIVCPVKHQTMHLADPVWRATHIRKKPYAGDDVILAHYHQLSAREIGLRLGITKSAVIGRARRLGLARVAEARADPASLKGGRIDGSGSKDERLSGGRRSLDGHRAPDGRHR